MIDVADGLWLWRLDHRDWSEDADWDATVTSTVVQSGREVTVLDPLAPPPEASEIWSRLDATPPTLAVVLKPDHVRDVDAFVARYGARAYGPALLQPTNLPQTQLQPLDPDMELPGGLRTLYDGRGRGETPLWLAQQRTIVFADALTERDGELRVWATPWHRERVLPALRAMLELPFERVIVSHGQPLHDRAAFERALALDPFEGDGWG